MCDLPFFICKLNVDLLSIQLCDGIINTVCSVEFVNFGVLCG